MERDVLLTVGQVADRFCVSAHTVRRWISEGRIRACRPGGREYRIYVDSLDGLYEPVLNNSTLYY